MSPRCTHPGCTSIKTREVKLLLYVSATQHHELTLPRERRCLEHQSPFAESYLTDKKWQQIMMHVEQDWKARGLLALTDSARVELDRGLTRVEYFGGEEPSRLIQVVAVRPDGGLENAGKIPVKG